MKRTAGTFLLGACLALLLAPTGPATPVSVAVAPDTAPAAIPSSHLGFAADASAEAQANASGPSPVRMAIAPPHVRDASEKTEIPQPDPDASFTAGVAATTLVGLGLLVYLWGHAKSWLVGSMALPLFSRIAGHKILDNDVRNRVHEAVSENPGITIKQITETLDIGWGTAVYHLKRLEEERLVVSERHRQFRRYFRNGGGIVNDDKVAYSELKHPTSQRLAAELLQRPGVGQKELCLAVGISAPLAHKYLARLEAAQLLTKQREWKTVRYFPTQRLGDLFSPAPTTVLVAA